MESGKCCKYVPLKNTNVSVKFLIFTYENTFNPDEITELLGIKPTTSYVQKNKIDENCMPIQETSWNLIIDYEESYDIEFQLNKIMEILIPKKETLIEIQKKYSPYMEFMIVINVEKGEWPAMYLQKDFIKFVADIGGEIQFDPYYY